MSWLRTKMARELGRELKSNEHVHHINGDRTDNRLENLVVLDAKEHALLHSAARASNSIGGRIRKARCAAGMTAAELAERTGVSMLTVYNWERDGFPLSRLPQIAEATGTPLERLMAEDVAA